MTETVILNEVPRSFSEVERSEGSIHVTVKYRVILNLFQDLSVNVMQITDKNRRIY